MDALELALARFDEYEPAPAHSCLCCTLLAACEDAETLYGTCRRFEALESTEGIETRAVPAEPLCFSCTSCDSHLLGWCKAVPGKAFYNVKFLVDCPLEESTHERKTS